MKRRQFLIKSLAASASVAVSPMILSSCDAGLNGKRLTILHTNDMHSHIEPFREGRYQGLGGMAARASAIQKIRETEAHVMLLDVGDVFQGTPYFNVFGGELELKLMSEMGYDATTVGNHEFDNGLDGLDHAMQFAKFPYLNANYDFSRNIIAGKVKPFGNKGGHIFRLNNVPLHKVGFSNKIGHKAIGRVFVDITRGADLLNVAVIHDRNAVRHGDRLFLIVGDIDKGNADLRLNLFEL